MSGAASNLSFAVRFRPVGPWRFGPDSGARDRVDLIYHSDAFYSAVCSAMAQLGLAEGMAAGDGDIGRCARGAFQLVLSVHRRHAAGGSSAQFVAAAGVHQDSLQGRAFRSALGDRVAALRKSD